MDPGPFKDLSTPLLGDWGGRPVTWTSLANTTATGGTLNKTGGTSDWNGGAISNETVLEELGDFGFVEARVTESNKKMAFGLSKGNSGTLLSDIDFALFAGSNASWNR